MRISLAILIAAAAPACAAMPGTEEDPSDPSDPSHTTPPPPPIAMGDYAVRSTVDLTVEAVLPQPAEDVVLTLRNFSTAPGDTLLDLASAAGVPAVDELRAALPSYLEDKLTGWIDAEIAKVTLNGTPITQVAGSIAALAETALTQFAIDSTLSIHNGTATHDLVTLDLSPAGWNKQLSLADLPSDLRSQTPACTSANGTLSIGDHNYGLPYGEYIWTAVNEQMIERYGYDLRGALGAAINCPNLAHTIANKCVLGVCVGHEAQLTEICEAGLDEAVAQVHDKLAEEKFDALHFAAGTATLVDANKDGTADAMTNGVWTAEINAGLGLRHVPATFTASR